MWRIGKIHCMAIVSQMSEMSRCVKKDIKKTFKPIFVVGLKVFFEVQNLKLKFTLLS